MKDTDIHSHASLPPAAPAWIGAHLHVPDPIARILSSRLSAEEKRATLSSWASDSRAVPDAPALRCLDDGATIGIDAILDALKKLDAPGGEPYSPASPAPGQPRFSPRGWVQAVFLGRRPDDDDDDDPPPCPAVIAPVPRLPPSGVEVELQAA